MADKLADKGKLGEDDLNDWLQENGLSYVAICQSPETFAPLFSGDVKRPDFLVLLESVGLIAVDAKNYQQSFGYTLNLEPEIRRAITFERLFRVPFWFAYRCEEAGKTAWYWISALKAVEVGEVRTNSTTKEQFVYLELEHFERVESNSDLGKLYTHRLRSVTKVKELPCK